MIAIRSTSSATSAVQRSASSALGRRRRRFKSTAPIPSSASESYAASGGATANTNASSSVPIGASLLAAAAGVGVVGLSAFCVEQATADNCNTYASAGDANAQRFDQETFGGRFARMLLACDPVLLLHGEDRVREARHLLDDFHRKSLQHQSKSQSQSAPALTPSESRSLWEAKRIVESAVHPDTGEFIPRPFRMSGYVPYNGPICVSMVASTSTVPLLFWSWVNQSQNALVNYYNRNASAPMSNETLLKSYSAAVGSAIVVAFGLSTFVQKRYSAAKAQQMMKYVAFPSAVVASSLNCYVVRSPEIDTGVPLTDKNGVPVVLPQENNASQIAARKGVESTTVSRAILQAPVYFLPPVLMGALPPLQRLLASNPRTRVPLTTFLVLVSFGLGLPATISIFPQVASINANEVESKYHNLIDPRTQKPYEVFYYNKGL